VIDCTQSQGKNFKKRKQAINDLLMGFRFVGWFFQDKKRFLRLEPSSWTQLVKLGVICLFLLEQLHQHLHHPINLTPPNMGSIILLKPFKVYMMRMAISQVE
jgi:hypothetical protein